VKVHKVVMVRNIVICWSLSSQVFLSLASLEVLVFVSAPDASSIGLPRILPWLWLSIPVRPRLGNLSVALTLHNVQCRLSKKHVALPFAALALLPFAAISLYMCSGALSIAAFALDRIS